MDFAMDNEALAGLLAQITRLRVERAESLRAHARARQRRGALTPDGKLVILAADHPGRMVTSALGDPTLLGNRREYLGRILRVLGGGAVDGLMGTPDLIEEVLAADLLHRESGGASFVDGLLLIGCMNRGGLSGTAFEMLDSYTGYDAAGLQQMNLDGGKLMFRLDPADPASGRTILWSAGAINDCLQAGLPVFVEPLMVRKQAGRYAVQTDVESLIRISGVAAALGRSSLGTWLKLPYGPGYERVAMSTTCPILMLGGEAREDPRPLLADIAAGMAAGANVRGALIGRNVLFPGSRDPLTMAEAVRKIVHEGATPDQAWQE